MRNLNKLKYTSRFLLLVVTLAVSLENATAQDFFLTKDYKLIRCEITVDSPAFIHYKKDGRTIKRKKSSILDYSVLSKRKKNIIEIINNQGLRLRGTFLFADKDSVYFWKGSKVYHPNKGTFLVLGINEIDRLVILRKGNFLKWFGIGLTYGFSTSFLLTGYYGTSLEESTNIALGTGLFCGVVFGSYSALTRKRFQFGDPKNALSEIHRLTQKNAMLSTPPIKAIGRDTTRANWVSNIKSLYKSKK